MRMDDETLKRILQEGMDYDADCIMREVNSDPNLQDVVIPEDMDANIKEEIERIKAAQAQEQDKQAQEEQELIRLGRLYKKKRARNKYIILIAAVVCALGVGTISFGDGKKVFTEIKRALGDREQTVVNSGDEEGKVVDEVSSEEEAYEQINEKFGFVPVRMHYLPKGMEFVDAVFEEELQFAYLLYSDKGDRSISYNIVTKHRDSSSIVDVEDEFIREFEKTVQDVSINIKEYKVEEDKAVRWAVRFVFEDIKYTIVFDGFGEEEVNQILENLYFV